MKRKNCQNENEGSPTLVLYRHVSSDWQMAEGGVAPGVVEFSPKPVLQSVQSVTQLTHTLVVSKSLLYIVASFVLYLQLLCNTGGQNKYLKV